MVKNGLTARRWAVIILDKKVEKSIDNITCPSAWEGGVSMEKAMEKKEACENCTYNHYTRKWYCLVMDDYVPRGGHCSEYEVRKDAGGCSERVWR